MSARIGRSTTFRACLLLLLLVAPPTIAQVPPDEEIRRIVAGRIDHLRSITRSAFDGVDGAPRGI
jgi:hypothetical protein